MMSQTNTSTFIDVVVLSLGSALRNNPGESVAPIAVLWPDADGQWAPVVEQLKPLLPHLFTLGEYAPDNRTGPGIWLKCVIARTLAAVQLPADVVPILYLPNVSRQALRAVESCPELLKPLVELQYRGTTWCQRNGKDWTIEAFLVSDEGGLGLDMSRDNATLAAMLRALPELCAVPVSRLQGKRLEAEDFEKLLVDDTPRDVLQWMNAPDSTRESWSPEKWDAFCSRCVAELGLNPESDGEITAAEKLGRRDGTWATVWERFEESPRLYPNLPDLLRRAKPQDLFMCKETWPDENDTAELALRDALSAMGTVDAATARTRLAQLEAEHAERREWVWSRLDLAPLAYALRHLAILADRTAHAIGGPTVETMVETYFTSGYTADQAVLDALSYVKKTADIAAVTAAIRAVYMPWLDESARNFQARVCSGAYAYPKNEPFVANPGECLLFVDGLRVDLSKRLVETIDNRGWHIDTSWALAALPTVTATSKHAASPMADKMNGTPVTANFAPVLVESGAEVTAPLLRKLLEAAGYQVLLGDELGAPGPDERAWAEYGEFDSMGHKLGGRLVGQIQPQLELLADRIAALVGAGWHTIRVITDHGWLFIPGELAVVPLSKHATESKWARCAALKPSAQTDGPSAPWFWNNSLHFAYAPGASAFAKGNEYAHGGISLQECVVPIITVKSLTSKHTAGASIADVQWLRLRCRVPTSGAISGCAVDLRTKVADAGTSLLADKAPRPVDADGRAGFAVEDDRLEGTAAFVVLLDSRGSVLAKRSTTIGGEE